MTPMSPEQIAQWKLDNPITRSECITEKQRLAFGNAHYHRDVTRAGRWIGCAISVQGQAGEEVLRITDGLCDPVTEYLKAAKVSISESLEGVG